MPTIQSIDELRAKERAHNRKVNVIDIHAHDDLNDGKNKKLRRWGFTKPI